VTGRSYLPPYDSLTTGDRRRRFGGLAALFAVTGIAIYLLLPDGMDTIVDFELAGDDEVTVHLDNWRPDGLWRVALAHVVDMAFLVAYGFGLALILDTVARWSTPLSAGWARFLARGAWLPIVAAGFDVVENLALLVVRLEGRTEHEASGHPPPSDTRIYFVATSLGGASSKGWAGGQRPTPPCRRTMPVMVRSLCSDRQVNMACASGSTIAGSSVVVRHVGSAARSKHSQEPLPNWT
jgi:hypothetical protein